MLNPNVPPWPPVRYAGAKWLIAPWIISNFPPHKSYVELFCGGAAVFFRKRPSNVETINDIDGDVVNFFDILRTRPDKLIRAIQWTPYARAEYERAQQSCDDPLERARRYYIRCWQAFGANRPGMSGWRHSFKANDVITKGERISFPHEFNRLDALYAAARRLKDAQIECMDAIECVQHYDGPDTLFYVDPPYVYSALVMKERPVYTHEMGDEQHHNLAAALHAARGMVILSGYQSPLYDELYSDWKRLEKSTTTNGKGAATESLWLSPNATQLQALPLFANL